MSMVVKAGFMLGSLASGLIAIGMAYGYVKAVKAKDEGKKKSYMISFFTFLVVALFAFFISHMIPGL